MDVLVKHRASPLPLGTKSSTVLHEFPPSLLLRTNQWRTTVFRLGEVSPRPTTYKLPLASAPPASEGRPAVYGVRPEHFTIADDGAEAEIIVVEPTGSETQVFAKLGGEQVVAVFRERHQFSPGDKVRLKPDPSLVHLFDETTGKRLNG